MCFQADELRRIDPETRALLRARMDSDPWYFFKYVCRQADLAVERIHRPLLYVYTGQAALLAATLDDPRFEGIIARQVREDFLRQSPPIDWRSRADLPRIKARLKRVYMCGPRGMGKSVDADCADLWETTVNPNLRVGIGSKSDPYAEKRVITIGEIVMSPEYAFWYPERVPLSPKSDVTMKALLLAGRTEKAAEATIEGRGITSQWRGNHYGKIRLDDIAGTEYGEASIEDALRFIAGIDALQIREVFGGSREVYIGTVSGELDDHSVLMADPGVLHIVMPIEEHEGGTTIENIFSDGTLTMPEDGWFTREAVNELKRKARANEDKHSIAELLHNFYMVPHKDGGSFVFTKAMLDAAKGIHWIFSEELQREVLMLPKKGKEKTCRDRSRPEFNADDWRLLDVKTLPRTARAWAADQSVSQTGDEWAFEYVVMDHEGVEILLDEMVGRGYDRMLDAANPFDKKCESPKHVGVDTNATQGMTVEWMTRTPEFQSLARRIEPITSGQEAKDAHIRRWIAGRMLTGDFYVNPRLINWIHEASRYQPRKPDGTLRKNAVDNRLDGTWMACSLCKRPPSPEQIEADASSTLLEKALSSRNVNRLTGIDNSNWMDCLPRGRAA